MSALFDSVKYGPAVAYFYMEVGSTRLCLAARITWECFRATHSWAFCPFLQPDGVLCGEQCRLPGEFDVKKATA